VWLDIEPSEYKNEYQTKLKEAIQTKINGQVVVNVDNEQLQTAVDFMEALHIINKIYDTKG